MIERFFELKPFIDLLAENDDDIAELSLNLKELKEVSSLREKLKDLSSVMIRLQVFFW